MRISDTRELCDFVLTHAEEFNHVDVATTFRQILKKESLSSHRRRHYKHWRSLMVYTLWRSRGTQRQVLFRCQLAGCCKHAVGVCDDEDNSGGRMMGQLERWAEVISLDGRSTCRTLQTRCGCLRRWGQRRGAVALTDSYYKHTTDWEAGIKNFKNCAELRWITRLYRWLFSRQ